MLLFSKTAACINKADSPPDPSEASGLIPKVSIVVPQISHQPLYVSLGGEAPKLHISMSTLNLPLAGMNSFSERRMAANNCITPSSLTISSLSVPASQFKRATSAPAMSKTNKRSNLGPGCSMLDWIRLCKSMPSNGSRSSPITEDELARHSTESDAWTAYKGMLPIVSLHDNCIVLQEKFTISLHILNFILAVKRTC